MPADTSPRSTSVDRHAAHGELAGDGACRRCRRRPRRRRRSRRSPEARSPRGNGSSASSRYWPMPVIHARPVISGTIAGRPPTVVSSTMPAGEARPDHRLVDERRRRRAQLAAGVQLRQPRRGARPARRAVQPAGVDRRRRARVGAVARRARGTRRGGSRAMRGSSGCDGPVGRVDGGHDGQRRASISSPSGAGRPRAPTRRRRRRSRRSCRRTPCRRRRCPSPGPRRRGRARTRNAGTLRSVTAAARPSSTATRASTSPAGVSSRTTVSGSVTGTMPSRPARWRRRSSRGRTSAGSPRPR